MAKITIIIPVYKVEKYLARCLDSLLAQTFTDFEAILINDCSPDNSGAICDEYAKKDSRIKVIHRERNGGLSAARNSGLLQSKGEFIVFIDSDDYVHESYLATLLDIAEKYDVDIVHCGYFEEVDGQVVSKEKLNEEDEGVMSSEQAYACLYGDGDPYILNFMVWNKIFRKEMFATLCFAEGFKSEDCIFFSQALMRAKQIYVTNKPLYYYCIRNDSIMGEMRKNKESLIKTHLLAYRQIAISAEESSEYIRELSNARLATFYVSAIKNKMLKGNAELKSMLKEDKKRFAFLKNKRIPLIKRIVLAIGG